MEVGTSCIGYWKRFLKSFRQKNISVRGLLRFATSRPSRMQKERVEHPFQALHPLLCETAA